MKEAACLESETVLSPASVAQLKANERQLLPKDGLSIETAPPVATPSAEPTIQFPITPPTSGVESSAKTSLLALVAAEDMEGIEVFNKGGVESEVHGLSVMSNSGASTARPSDITLNTPPQSASPSSSASTPASDKDACPLRTGSPLSPPTQATTKDAQKVDADRDTVVDVARTMDAIVDEDVDMTAVQNTHEGETAAHEATKSDSNDSSGQNLGQEEDREADADENVPQEQANTYPYSSTTSSAASSVASLLASEPTIIPGPESIYAAVPISREIYIIPHSSKGFHWNEDLFLKPHQRRSLGIDDMYEALENGSGSGSMDEDSVHVTRTVDRASDGHEDDTGPSSSSNGVNTTEVETSSSEPSPQQRRFSRTAVVPVHEIRLGDEDSTRILPW